MSGVRSAADDVDIDLGQLFASIARNWRRIAIVALALTAIAFIGVTLATPKYAAETRILIETRESVFTRPENNADSDRPILDEEGVVSQVEVIASTDILKKVALKLDLASRDEFDAKPSMLGRALVLAGLKSDPGEIPPEERVLRAFREKLEVYRVEKSRVLVIEFSSEDPKLAAEVPNAIADEYIAMQRAAKLESNSDATEWLEPEIAELRNQVREAEARVADFRSKYDLLVGQDNAVLATQQLSELSTELSRVRANRAAAEAKAKAVRSALQGGASLDTIPDVLASGLIQRLRERQVQLRADIADLSTTLLGNHPRIRALNSQLSDLDSQIRREAQKVLEGLETEASTANFREQQLVADLNKLKAESARAGNEQVELRALEREAAAQRELLESYLTRYREAASRRERNYLPADARIFSRATVPSIPYFPKKIPILAATFIAALLIMAIVTMLQELFSGRALRAAPGAGIEPVTEVAMRPSRVEADVLRHEEEAAAARDAGSSHAAIHVPVDGEITIGDAAEKLIASGAARALFVSPEGDEAAAASVLVAREIADAGLRVLLLDLTASGAASRAMLESRTYRGITDLLASEAQFSDVIHADPYSECHVIPTGTASAAKAMRAAERLPIIMESLTTAYDLVVVECGPADAAGIRRLAGADTEIFVSMLDPQGVAAQSAVGSLKSAGYGEIALVNPVGYEPPFDPIPGRSAA